MALSPAQSARHARHIVLKDLGGAGQQRLAGAHVALIGAGGLGAPAIAYLVGAGVGRLTIVDPDRVALSNLPRQVIYTETDIGRFKAEAAADYAAARDGAVEVVPRVATADAETAGDLIAGADIVLEGTDSFIAKRAVAAACAGVGIPLVTGALGPFDGSLTVLAPFRTDAEGRACPGFAALYPVAPTQEDSPPCELVGVLNVLPGIVGTMMANAAIQWIAGIGEPLLGKLLIYSARTGESRIMRYR